MRPGAVGGLAKELSAASARNDMAAETRRDSAKICVRDWNFLVRMIAPAAACLARLLNSPLIADSPGGRPRSEAIRRIRALVEETPPRTFALF